MGNMAILILSLKGEALSGFHVQDVPNQDSSYQNGF